MTEQYVLVRGNLSEGFQFMGPFASFDLADEANDQANNQQGPLDSWIATLKLPPVRLFECGGCGCYHPFGWSGDCRDDSQRYADPADYAERHKYKGDILIVDEETGGEA